MEVSKESDNWDIVIKPKVKGIHLNLGEVWKYKDLLFMYVHREFIATYKQTILGPLWFFIQPIFTVVIYTFVFGGIAQIPTDGLPPMLFYMAGSLCWSYFSDCLTRSSETFKTNATVFSKVYFPRLVVPLSGLIAALVKMFIQLGLLIAFYVYFFLDGAPVLVNAYAFLFPLLMLMLAGIGFGVGVLISSVTIKYRDLSILFTFVVNLVMYMTPVIYPLSAIPEKYSSYRWIIQLNPLSAIVETFRYGVLGTGYFSWASLAYSFVFTVVIVLLGISVFNKVERRFVDII